MENGKVVICNNHRDRMEVTNIVDSLKINKDEIWMDVSGIDSGDDWREKVEAAMKNSRVAMIFQEKII